MLLLTRAERLQVLEDIQLPDEVTVATLAVLLEVKVEELEEALVELGEPPSSVEDAISLANAELAAMTFGRNVILPQVCAPVIQYGSGSQRCTQEITRILMHKSTVLRLWGLMLEAK